MTIEQMRLFSVLCGTLNFTRAAEKSYMTQEALSYQIRQMEKELGYPLFVRNHKMVELTQEGEKWRSSMESILHIYDKTSIGIEEMQNDHRPVLNISSFGYEFSSMLELLIAYQKEHPEIDFRVLTETDGNHLQMLCELKTDLLYVGHEIVDDYPMLGFQPIGQYCNGFVLREDHPLAQRESLSWADVASENMILPSALTSDPMKAQNISFQRILAEHCPGCRVLYASDFSASLTMVELGMGLMPTSFDVRQIGKQIGTGCIQIPREASARSDIGIAYHTGNPKACVHDFLRFVCEKVKA